MSHFVSWLSRFAALALVAASTPLAHAVTIAAWDFTGENTLATSSADLFSTGLDSSSLLTRGPAAAASAGANSFRTQGFANDGISTANTDYFQLTLSAAPGFSLSLTSITIRTNGTATYAASPGVTQQWAYSLDGSTFTLIGSPVVTTGTSQTAMFDLSMVSALQNMADTTTVTLRYYASGQTSTGGWGFFSNASGDYGLVIDGMGVPAAIPEPATYMLMGVGILICAQQFRKRRS